MNFILIGFITIITGIGFIIQGLNIEINQCIHFRDVATNTITFKYPQFTDDKGNKLPQITVLTVRDDLK